MELFFKDFNIWLQGMLFVLAIYHIGAYVFTKDKSFSLYAIYLLLVLIYLIPKSQSQTAIYLTEHYSGFFNSINWIIPFWLWLFYTWFSIVFLNIEEKSKTLSKISYTWIISVAIISTIFFFVDILFFGEQYLKILFLVIYTPLSFIYIAYFLINIFKYKDPLNVFYFLGFFAYLTFALIALYFSLKKQETVFNYMFPIDFFMIGVFLEAVILSIGLGYKYHIYRIERDNVHLKLIKELQRNDTLKDQLNEQLSERVAITSIELQNLSKQAELHKIEQLKTHYKNEINELKLSSLLSQMNPHFIFNALNSIKLYIINNQPKKAARYLNKFSKLIRRILEASKSKNVSLDEELETMELYMSIENIRFSNEIDFKIQVDDSVDVETVKIPPLLIQPFLENAIWEGLSSKKDKKKIVLTAQQKGVDFVEITIEDNGISREVAAKINAEKYILRENSSLELTKNRLQNFTKDFKNNYSLTFKDVIDENKNVKGTKVSLELPLF